MRNSTLSTASLSSALRRTEITIALAFLVTLFITPLVWHRIDRSLPACPLFPALVLPSFLFPLAMVALVGGLIFCLYPRTAKLGLGISLATWIVYVLNDINCFQPSLYFFSFVLLIGWFYRFQYLKEGEAFGLIKCAMACLYLFGGIQKINPVYQETIYVWLVQYYLDWLGPTLGAGLQKIGPLTPFVEIIIGIGLLFPRSGKWAATCAIAMHLFVLGALGPWAEHFNYVVFPWNIALIVLNVLLLALPSTAPISTLMKNKIAIALLCICWLSPFPYFGGNGDSYVSHDLYSGKAHFGFIVLPNKDLSYLPISVQDHFLAYDSTRSYVSLTDWSLQELAIPIYPEKRVYLFYKKWFESYVKDAKSVELIIYSQKKHETIR